MTAKEFLNKANRLDDEINAMQETLDSMRALAEKVTATLSAMPKGGSDDHSKENIIIKMAELNESIEDDIDHLLDAKAQIINVINMVQNSNHRVLLWERYINHKRWEAIAVSMNFELRTIHRMHGNAIIEVSSILPKVVTKCH